MRILVFKKHLFHFVFHIHPFICPKSHTKGWVTLSKQMNFCKSSKIIFAISQIWDFGIKTLICSCKSQLCVNVQENTSFRKKWEGGFFGTFLSTVFLTNFFKITNILNSELHFRLNIYAPLPTSNIFASLPFFLT